LLTIIFVSFYYAIVLYNVKQIFLNEDIIIDLDDNLNDEDKKRFNVKDRVRRYFDGFRPPHPDLLAMFAKIDKCKTKKEVKEKFNYFNDNYDAVDVFLTLQRILIIGGMRRTYLPGFEFYIIGAIIFYMIIFLATAPYVF
jgi:DNA gyrase/topoisomerase IV subunit B